MNVSRFESVGMYAPDWAISTQELVDKMEHKPPFDVTSLTGIERRRHRKNDEDTFSISINAMKECLKNSGYDAKDLDIIITCSISKFNVKNEIIWEPSVALILKNAIGASRASCFSISNACAGMGTGVHLLNNMIRAGVVKNGMVVSGECITHISDTAVEEITEPFDRQFGSLTVGDAGAAVIMDVSPDGSDGIDYSHFVTMAEFSDLCFGLPSDKTGGAAMYSDSIKLHQKSIDRMGKFIQGVFFRKNGAEIWDRTIDWVVPHQTSTKAMATGIKTVNDYLNIGMDYLNRVVVTKYITEFGNTASTSHFVVLYNALKDGLIKKGDKVLLWFMASGIVFGAVAFTVGAMTIQGNTEVKPSWGV